MRKGSDDEVGHQGAEASSSETGSGVTVEPWTIGATAADLRVGDALPAASAEVAELWEGAQRVTRADLPPAGLTAGERPSADVEVLAGTFAAAEFELARRMHSARSSGCLPLHDPGAMLAAKGWAVGTARRLARTGALAAEHPALAAAWAAGVITSEHVDAVARVSDRFTVEELGAVITELTPHWGVWSPRSIAQFVSMAARMLHPPADQESEESAAYESRNLSFALTRDSVLISGVLPRVEGELVVAAIDAFAERLRSLADHVPASARRADALVELVNTAHATGALPTRGGLPVSVTVTLDRTECGDPLWVTSRGHELTEAEARWSACDTALTPVMVDTPGCPQRMSTDPSSDVASPATRIAALAAAMFETRMPLAVGRTQRTATAAQRRSLAIRDRGCIIPGCGIPAEACQTHHLVEWAEGGSTDLPNMALLCWAHHRQVDLRMWTIHPAGLDPGGPPSTAVSTGTTGWPGNNGSPWTIRAVPRTRWRM